MTWTNQRYSLPDNAILPKEGISVGLTYFSHELVGYWSFHTRLWVAAYASLVFFSIPILTKQFLVIVFSLSSSFLVFLLPPAHWGFVGLWARSHMELCCPPALSHMPISTAGLVCTIHIRKKQLLCVLPRIPSLSRSMLSPTSLWQADLKEYQAWSIINQ